MLLEDIMKDHRFMIRDAVLSDTRLPACFISVVISLAGGII